MIEQVLLVQRDITLTDQTTQIGLETASFVFNLSALSNTSLTHSKFYLVPINYCNSSYSTLYHMSFILYYFKLEVRTLSGSYKEGAHELNTDLSIEFSC